MTTEKKSQSSKAKASGRGKGGSARKSSRKGKQEAAPPAPSGPRPMPRLLGRFRSDITPQLMKEFEYSSVMQVPRLTKVMMNIGIGEEASQNSQAIENATGDIARISGQRPVVTRAKKSIAGFKLREGTPVGVAVTLRDRRMYEFFDRLVSSSLPESGTSGASPPSRSTAGETTRWASASRSYSRKSTTTPSTGFGASRLLSPRRRGLTGKDSGSWS